MNWTEADLQRMGLTKQPDGSYGKAQAKADGGKNPGPPQAPRTFTTAPQVQADVARLNKTERAFLAHLQATLPPGAWIGTQTHTLKLAERCRYTPDFTTLAEDGARLVMWEVKGFWRDDALVKIKTAARLYPYYQFIAAQRKKGEWVLQEFKP